MSVPLNWNTGFTLFNMIYKGPGAVFVVQSKRNVRSAKENN